MTATEIASELMAIMGINPNEGSGESGDLLAELRLRLRPRETDVILARGVLALMRAHEQVAEPETWEVSPAQWGDGRWTYEVHDRSPSGPGLYTSGLVCQFRPDDIDGTEALAQACIDAAKLGVSTARDVLETDALLRACFPDGGQS